MDEYINREDVLKCLEYNTIQKPSANDVVSTTLRVAREKVEKLPAVQEGALLSFWRDPDKDPPKVETEVLILFETACGGYGITTAHYEDGTVLSEKSKFYWEEIFEWAPMMKSMTIISSPKAGGNIVISTRRMFTTTVLILLWLGGCLCRRRR